MTVDGVSWIEQLTYCDGADSTIIANTECTIPIDVLTEAPYGLSFGSSVFAQVSATNSKGTSAESEAGNGATVITVPGAPINLAEDTQYRTAKTLGLSW